MQLVAQVSGVGRPGSRDIGGGVPSAAAGGHTTLAGGIPWRDVVRLSGAGSKYGVKHGILEWDGGGSGDAAADKDSDNVAIDEKHDRSSTWEG